MAKLKQGFGYIYFMIVFFIAITLAISLSIIATKHKKIQALDLAKIKANYYAQSAAEYYKKNSTLPENNISESQLTKEKLLQLPGYDHKMKNGGFKIIKNNENIYFLGWVNAQNKKTALTIIVKNNTLNTFNI